MRQPQDPDRPSRPALLPAAPFASAAMLAAMLAAVLAAATAAADVVPVTYHPYPDDADPLGFPYLEERDAFTARHAFRFEGIPPYPYIVIDGTLVIAGIPDIDRPMESMRETLAGSVATRTAEPAPLTLALESTSDGAVTVRIAPAQGLGPGRLWLAITEDHVHFEPPQALSNGVTDHRFTLRALMDAGEVDLSVNTTRDAAFALDPAWDASMLHAVAWVEAGSSDARFTPREVLQAASHPLGGPQHVQAQRGVLVEMLSATWCPPCIYGDNAVSELAGGPSLEAGPRYYQPLGWPVWAAAAAGALAFAWRRP